MLTERFFNGQTSIEEEQELYQMFQQADLPADLLSLRPLFAGFRDIQLNQRQTPRIRWIRLFAVAASIAVVLTATITIMGHDDPDECVTYIYGKKCTDKAIVMHHMKSDLSEMSEFNTVDELMRDMFSE